MTEEYKPFKLTKAEVDSALWKRLDAWCQVNLSTSRAQNDHMTTEDRTAFLRGKIAAYKEFLDLGIIQDEN